VVEAAASEADTSGARQVAAFITSYYGNGGPGQDVRDPMRTVATVDHHGLVAVEIDGSNYVITDIGMRMLSPRELARAMGFPEWYRLESADGKPLTQRAAVKMIGNACPVNTVKELIKAVVMQRPASFGLREAA
jgi:DNA (cytosine-5)-methyltransferase 1